MFSGPATIMDAPGLTQIYEMCAKGSHYLKQHRTGQNRGPGFLQGSWCRPSAQVGYYFRHLVPVIGTAGQNLGQRYHFMLGRSDHSRRLRNGLLPVERLRTNTNPPQPLLAFFCIQFGFPVISTSETLFAFETFSHGGYHSPSLVRV
jgi:hypothetical protein